MTRVRRHWLSELRRNVHIILDGGGTDSASRLFHASLVALVCGSIASVVLETVPELSRSYGAVFSIVEGFAAAAFTVEYLLRLWVAPDHTPYVDVSPLQARLRFILTISAMIDLLSILPFYLTFFLP